MTHTPTTLDETRAKIAASPAHATGAAPVLSTYDAGLLSDYGGGNVEWWQDYVRVELAQAHEFYASQWPSQDADFWKKSFQVETRARIEAEEKFARMSAPQSGAAMREALEATVKRIDEMFDAFLDRYATYDGNVSTDDLADYLFDVRNEVRALSPPAPKGEAALALASPQHPVGVREALESKGWTGRKCPYCKGYGVRADQSGEERTCPDCSGTGKEFAALSHPPAQDAPGAEVSNAALAQMALCQVAWIEEGKGEHPHRLDTIRDALARLAALDPPPPLPEADGEVVAWVYEIQQHDDSWRADLSFSRSVAPYGGAIRNIAPLVRQSALVSALREREEAREKIARVEADRDERWTQAEKAEQVAAGLREAVQLALPVLRQSRGERLLADMAGAAIHAAEDALHASASTEEGKTATPSVTDEEAGRG